MKILIDTQILLWLFMDTRRIPPHLAGALADADGVYASIVSIIETGIKQRTGKLNFRKKPHELYDAALASGIGFLQIEPAVGTLIAEMPRHHNDPFDRMLIAQAMHHRLSIATTDRHFGLYDVPLVR